MACSIAGRTLKFLSWRFRSDLAAPGAFLRESQRFVLKAPMMKHDEPEKLDDSTLGSVADHAVGVLEQIHEERNVATELQALFLVHLIQL